MTDSQINNDDETVISLTNTFKYCSTKNLLESYDRLTSNEIDRELYKLSLKSIVTVLTNRYKDKKIKEEDTLRVILAIGTY